MGNPHVKKDGVVQQWDKPQVEEYAKCMQDPIYFAGEHTSTNYASMNGAIESGVRVSKEIKK